jgi:hypothetical protein
LFLGSVAFAWFKPTVNPCPYSLRKKNTVGERTPGKKKENRVIEGVICPFHYFYGSVGSL